MNLTPDEVAWLATNRESYEYYLVHSMLHDRGRLNAMMGVPLVPADFANPAMMGIVLGLAMGLSITKRIGVELPAPPTGEFLRTYIEAANKKDGDLDENEVTAAVEMVTKMQDPSTSQYWYCIDRYFEVWLTTVRAKRLSRQVAAKPVLDVGSLVESLQRDSRAAASAIYRVEDDDMESAFTGTSEVYKQRRSTGIEGLDRCLNGGWGDGECYLLFGGTGSGKSISAAQTAWHNAFVGGYSLVVSTELPTIEVINRIVSCACGINIEWIQDCLNVGQIRQAVAMKNPVFLDKLNDVLHIIRTRMRIVKIHPDQGMNARGILEQQLAIFEQRMGVKPNFVVFDWLGRVADMGGDGKSSSADRAMVWERSADGCVQFAEVTGIPTLVLAQGQNNCHLKFTLTLDDIGISKGIAKQMVAVIGITNTVDKAAIAAAAKGVADMPKKTTLDDQFMCVCKARKGEGSNIPVQREFRYQRFSPKPKIAA